MPNHNNSSLIPPWYERFSLIFQEEKDILEGAGFVLDEQFKEVFQTIRFTGSLPEYQDRSLIITFPAAYPSVAPTVSDNGNCDLLPRHQNPTNRNYCLFGPEAKNWYAKLDSNHVLSEILRLFSDIISPPGLVDSQADPYPEPASVQFTEPTIGTLLVPPPISELLPSDTNSHCAGSFRVTTPPSKDITTSRSIVLSATFDGKGKEVNCHKVYRSWFGKNERKGIVYFIPNPSCAISSITELKNELASLGEQLKSNYDWTGVLIPEQSGSRDGIRYAWKTFRKIKGGIYKPVNTITYTESEKEARIPGLQFLRNIKIALIGCGSLGSKIAVNMAASGVEYFTLFDKDIMGPANSIRHECGIPSFGLPKSVALINRLLEINPNIRVQSTQLRGCLGQQDNFSDEQDSIEFIKKADLVINATGHGNYSRYINEICYLYRIPNIHVSVTNGAWSGEVIRVIPEKTPCWLCWNQAFGDEKESPPAEPFPEHGFLFAPGCDQPTFTGTTHEVGMVANLASSFAIDTLKMEMGHESEYEDDYLIWRGRDKEGKLVQKMESKAIPWRGHYKETGAGCSLCNIEQ